MPPCQLLVGNCGALHPVIPVPDGLVGEQTAVAVLNVLQFTVVHQLTQPVFTDAADLAHLFHRFENGKIGGFCLFAFGLSRHNGFLLFMWLVMAYSLKGIWADSVFKVHTYI